MKVPFPILMDDITDPTATRWGGWPIRMFVVKQDGSVGYTSINGPYGFRPDATFLHGDGLPATNNADRGYNQESLDAVLEDFGWRQSQMSSDLFCRLNVFFDFFFRQRSYVNASSTHFPSIAANPADFEPQEALVFGCGQLVKAYPQTFVDFVRGTHERVKLFGVISEKHVRLAEILLSVAGLPKDSVEYLVADTSAMWVRDFSPISALDENGKRVFLNFDYGHMNLRNDRALRRFFEEHFEGTFVDVSLSLEGGNLLSNGAGLVLTSKTINSQNAARGDTQFLNQVIRAATGCSQWAAVNSLSGERTGHVDLLASFLTPTRLLVGQVDPSQDSFNAHLLDDIASSLNGLATAAGPLEVVRIPMPCSADGMIRSYTNLLIVNGLILVPIYPTVDPGMDWRVVDMLSDLMPSHEVRGLDCSHIVNKGGSIHCMSMNVASPGSARSNVLSPNLEHDRQALEASGTDSKDRVEKVAPIA